MVWCYRVVRHNTGGKRRLMDIRNLFLSISREMAAKFDQSNQVQHSGGKGSIREDHFLDFLKQYMPNRYAVGRGEVVTPRNYTSGQLDVVIYDPVRCPVLMPSDSHAVYPIESVYGAISVKSRLNAGELEEAYQNIESLKKIVSQDGFTSSSQPGFMVGFTAPTPITGIFAYATDRSMKRHQKTGGRTRRSNI